MEVKKNLKLLFGGFLIVILSFFFDSFINGVVEIVRNDATTSIMHFITDFGVIFLVLLVGVVALKQKKYRFLIFMTLCAVISIEITFLLKLIFQVPRPYMLIYEEPLFLASGYSFPSIHTAFIFSLIPYQKYLFKKSGIFLIYLFMFLIVISRVYLGVHNISDVIAGAYIGLITTYTFVNAENKYRFIEWFTSRITDKFELRRQTAHLLIGVSIVFLLKLQLLSYQILFFITLIGGILVLIARKTRIPVIHDLLEFFERPHHIARFPGRGSFFLILGAALSTLIFEKDIAMAAIMIMAVGDSVTNIVGRHFGKIQNPFNPKKNLEGTVIAVIASTFAAFYFVPLWPAFVASLFSMLVESIDLGWKKYEIEIDDNVLIPLISGVILSVMLMS